jgi:GNAT superfamily N-acetyltransferase
MLHPSDVEALRGLWTAAFRAPRAEQDRWLRDPRRVLVERDAGTISGACVVSALRLFDARGEHRIAWLRALAVRPDRRGRGTGARLVARALQLSRARGFQLALRSPRRDLYARAGLRVAGEVVGALLAAPLDALEPTERCVPRVLRRGAACDAARACALATGCAIPVPGPRLRSVARRGAMCSLPDGSAAGVVAREGVAWLAADSIASAARFVHAAMPRGPGAGSRVDAHPSLLAGIAGVQARALGPWWCSAEDWSCDLPASVLSCLD